MLVMVRIGLVNFYLEGRERLMATGEYPSHHLWGADHVPKEKFRVTIIPGAGTGIVNRVGRWLSRVTGYRFGDLDQEWEIWKRRSEIDIVYVAAGFLFFLYILRALRFFRPSIVAWAYTPRTRSPSWTLRNFRVSAATRGTDLLLCLTHRAAEAWRPEMPEGVVVQMDWGADMDQFRPGLRDGGFFFGCGKTNRDYAPLLESASRIPAPIHLVVHREFVDGRKLPSNVHLEGSSLDASCDRGISYPDLLSRYFHRALAVLIALKPIPDDASGMTNLLEAMACGLPVIMTRTGAIDIDIEAEGIGIYVEPGDVSGWASACRWLLEHPAEALAMGDRGRSLVERRYNTRRLGQDLGRVFEEVLAAHSGSV